MSATFTQSTFAMEYGVSATMPASAERVWALLTDAANFPSWNSTVTSIDGPIVLGQKLAIRVPLAPGRTFSPKVSTFEPARRMVWSDGMAPMFKGERTFTLTPNDDGTTEFTMVEAFWGVMLPLIKGSLPDFRPVFDQYVADLARAGAS